MDNVDLLEKARSGKYADTPENRRLKRVGQEYGKKKQDDAETSKTSAKKDDNKAKHYTTEELAKYARKTADKDLKRYSTGEDEMMRMAAKAEIDRRKNEEYPQKLIEQEDKEFEERLRKRSREMSDEDLDKHANGQSRQLSALAKEEQDRRAKEKTKKKEKSKFSKELVDKYPILNEEIKESDNVEVYKEQLTKKYKALLQGATKELEGGSYDNFTLLNDEASKISQQLQGTFDKNKEKQRKQDEWIKEYDLHEDNIASIEHYIGSGYRDINKSVANGDTDKYDVQALRKALEKFPKFEGTVYRGTSKLNFPDIDSLKVGESIQLPTFTSSSTDKGMARMFAKDIHITIKSKTGRDMGPFNEKESEIIFDFETRFRVVGFGKAGGEYQVELEEI